MKPRCILHIGMPKTGSSSIQASLYNNKAPQNFDYLKIGNGANHSPIIHSVFSKHPENYYVHKNLKRTKEQIEEFNKDGKIQLIRALSSSKSKNVVISGEDILFLSEDELAHLNDFLMIYCSDVQVIAYVRPPISFMQSAFQQLVKMGELSFGIGGFFPQYQQRFEKFDRVFGHENVTFIKFDRDSLKGGDVVVDFCERIGGNVEQLEIIRFNDAIPLEAVAFLFVYQKYIEKSGNFSTIISDGDPFLKELSLLGNKKLIFSNALVKSILSNIADDICWMENRLNCSLAESTPDNDDDGISSEDDLIAIAFANRDKLSELVSKKIAQQMISPENIAETVALLRRQCFFTPASSHPPQLSQLESPVAEKLFDMLRKLELSLWRVGQTKAARKILGKISDLKYFLKISPVIECNLSCSIDLYRDGYLMGWIVDRNNPLHRLAIEIRQGQKVIAEGVANKYREDLAVAKIGDGRCAFVVKVGTTLKNDGGNLVLRAVELNHSIEVDINSIEGIAGA